LGCGDGLLLLLRSALARLLTLDLVNVLHQHALVLEDVTLALHVEVVVLVLVQLLRGAILAEQAAQHALAADPEDLRRHARIAGTMSLTSAGVSSLALGFGANADAGAAVDGHGLLNDETAIKQTANRIAYARLTCNPQTATTNSKPQGGDGRTGLGGGDLSDLIGIQPHLPLTTGENASGKALLQAERHHD